MEQLTIQDLYTLIGQRDAEIVQKSRFIQKLNQEILQLKEELASRKTDKATEVNS